jgi:hypothetical protein
LKPYISCQANENYTGIASRDTANALRVLTDAVRGVAAALEDRDDQKNIIKAAQEVMRASARLLEEAKKATSNPNDPNNQQRLGKVGIQRVSYGLSLDIAGSLWIELGYIMGHVWSVIPMIQTTSRDCER